MRVSDSLFLCTAFRAAVSKGIAVSELTACRGGRNTRAYRVRPTMSYNLYDIRCFPQLLS